MDNYVNGHFIETFGYAIVIVVICLPLYYLLDEGEFVIFVTSVVGPV